MTIGTNWNVVQLREEKRSPVLAEYVGDASSVQAIIDAEAERIKHLITKHGAVLLRGLHISNAAEIKIAASGICGQAMENYGDLPLTNGDNAIYKATPYPSTHVIAYHNEGAHLPVWPGIIMFLCTKSAESGGATPIVNVETVLDLLDPKLVELFRTKGLSYHRSFIPGLDVSWQEFFKTSDKGIATKKCAQVGLSAKWQDDVLTTTFSCAAVRLHPATGRSIFFNQVLLHHKGMLDANTRESLELLCGNDICPRHVTFGDGTEIPMPLVHEICTQLETAAFRFDWLTYDLIVLDNMQYAHGRDTYSGDRQISVALGNPQSESTFVA